MALAASIKHIFDSRAGETYLIEESISGHASVAEVAVVGVADTLKGQVAMAFVVPRDSAVLDDPAALQQIRDRVSVP